MKVIKSNNEIYQFSESGFSLIELVVVIAVLATLTSVSVPSILKTLKLNRLDEIKILMDSYAVECLQEFRLGNQLSNVTPTSFSEKKIQTLGFQKTNGSNCEKFGLEPSDKTDNLLFSLDFRIGNESGTLIKTASPPTDEGGLVSCESWAGDLCTSNSSLKTSWDNTFATEKNKSICEDNFYTWKNSSPSGSFNRWDDISNTCSKKTWVHKSYIADSELNYQKIKSNEECSDAKKLFSTFTGEKYISECQITYYFFNGVDMGSKEQMQVKLIEDEEIKCKVNRESQRLTASNGKYKGETSSGDCGNYYWICNQRILSNLDQWKESDCYTQ